jgi:hypothetical protein
MIRAWLLPFTRWARYWYQLGALDAAGVPNPYGQAAARRRAAGLLDRPRHRAEDREPTSLAGGAGAVRVG